MGSAQVSFQGAFGAALQRAAQRPPRKDDAEKAVRVRAILLPDTVVEGQGEALVVAIPYSEIAKAKPARAKDNGKLPPIGFLLEEIVFQRAGQTFALRPGWVSLVAR